MSLEDEPTYATEFEHLTLVRLELARFRAGKIDLSLQVLKGFLSRLCEAAVAQGRGLSVIETSVLLALVAAATGE